MFIHFQNVKKSGKNLDKRFESIPFGQPKILPKARKGFKSILFQWESRNNFKILEKKTGFEVFECKCINGMLTYICISTFM